MGTSAVITFVEDDREVETYKHWDGYRSNTVPLLARYHQWNGRNGSQVGYYAATWFYWIKHRECGCPREPEEVGHNADEVLSYGVRPDPDVEIANCANHYTVDIVEGTVKHEESGEVYDLTREPAELASELREEPDTAPE